MASTSEAQASTLSATTTTRPRALCNSSPSFLCPSCSYPSFSDDISNNGEELAFPPATLPPLPGQQTSDPSQREVATSSVTFVETVVNPKEFSLVDGSLNPISVLDRRISAEAALQPDGTFMPNVGELSDATKLVLKYFLQLTGYTIVRLTEVEIKVASPKSVTCETMIKYGTSTYLPIAQKLYNGVTGEQKQAAWLKNKRSVESNEPMPFEPIERRLMQIKNCAFNKISTLAVLVVDIAQYPALLFPAAPTSTLDPSDEVSQILSEIASKAANSPFHHEAALNELRRALAAINAQADPRHAAPTY